MASAKRKRVRAKHPSQPAAPGLLPAKFDGRATLNVPEVAEILGIGAWAAWHATKTKRGNPPELPTIRIGGRVLVPRQVVERLLTSV
jgi:hypothetical protein